MSEVPMHSTPYSLVVSMLHYNVNFRAVVVHYTRPKYPRQDTSTERSDPSANFILIHRPKCTHPTRY